MGGARHREQLAELGKTLQFDDAVNIQFTSGTTGSPKGVTLTHHNILNNGYLRRPRDAPDRAGPHLHSGAALSLLWHGDGQSRLPSRSAPPWSIPAKALTRWRRCGRSSRRSAPRSTACRRCSSPNSIIRSSRRFDLTSLRTGIMAGAPCPIEVMKRVNNEMNMGEVTIAYGMTETSPGQLPERDSTIRWSGASRRSGASIRMSRSRSSTSRGKIVPRGCAGELCTRGYSVMLGYWDERGEDRRRARRRRAGCTPATSPPSTTKAIATSSAASRTW